MSLLQYESKYPPVNKNPTVYECMVCARTSDYIQMGGITIGSWGFGFIRGKPARFGMAGLMSGIGFTFATMVLLQNVRGRLMGFRENAREMKKYGTPTADEGALTESTNWKHFN